MENKSAYIKETSKKMIKKILLLGLIFVSGFYFYFRADYHTISGQVFGTYYQITTLGENKIHNEIKQEFQKINEQMSVFDTLSELNKINQTTKNKAVEVSSELYFVLKTAQEISRQTDGYFDITTGGLVDLWGFGVKDRLKIPSAEDVKSKLTEMGYDKLILQNQTVSRLNDNLSLNLSAIAKGYAVDQVALLLTENGYQNYMVNIGGEIIVKGAGPKTPDGWQIGLQYPDKESDFPLTTLILTDIALATSGNYQKFFTENGQEYSHIINPKTGWPVQGDVVSVTVLNKSTMEADALATALLAMGSTKGIDFAQAEEIMALFFIEQNGEIKIIQTNTASLSLPVND